MTIDPAASRCIMLDVTNLITLTFLILVQKTNTGLPHSNIQSIKQVHGRWDKIQPTFYLGEYTPRENSLYAACSAGNLSWPAP